MSSRPAPRPPAATGGALPPDPLHDSVMAAVRDAVVSADEHGRIVFFNGAAEAMFGMSAGQALGRPITDLMPERYHAAHRAGMARLAATGRPRTNGRVLELEAVGADGEEFPVELSLGTSDAGGSHLFTAVLRDISERRRIERTLLERARELERSNAELQEFAYVASHDLLEPLRMITSYLGLLQRRYGGSLGDDADRFIEHAVDGADRMRDLIDALLAYSRAGSGELRRERVDTTRLVRQVAEVLTAGRTGAAPTIEIGELPPVEGDPRQLGQLFQNLIGNSLKFAAPDRAPVVEVSAEVPEDGGPALFTVADNGIGIDPGHADRVFRMFSRLHTRDEYPGTGVGLAVARKVVERHGGRICAQARPDGGTALRFELPVAGRLTRPRRTRGTEAAAA